jgi:hypothetical protein
VRNRLSAWYFGDRVELPATEWQVRAVRAVTADPEEFEKAHGD